MDPATTSAVKANLAPSALPAIEDWERFPWHRSGGAIDTMRVQSSQALAIDVFGTLKATEQHARDRIVAAVLRETTLPTGGPWSVELEWTDPQNRLRETGTRSQVDVLLASPHALICVEAKFTEPDGGSCSQPNPIGSGRHRGVRQCDGSYVLQTNPVNGRTHRCALAAKGIRYWDVIPQVLNASPDVDYRPCPFAGPAYQWMRNLCSASAAARAQGTAPGVLVVYAEGSDLPMAQKVRSPEWAAFAATVRTDRIVFKAISYQWLIERAIEAVEGDPLRVEVWSALQRWVDAKVARCSRTV